MAIVWLYKQVCNISDMEVIETTFFDIDYYFSYKHLLRFILVNKINKIYNTYSIPFLKNVEVFFAIKNVETLENSYFYNYIYLMRVYFGAKSFFCKYSSYFKLGKTYHSFVVKSFFCKKYSYSPVWFLVNDLLFMTSANSRDYYFPKSNVFLLRFFQMNVFLEKKTHVGFFHLKHFLNASLHFSSKSFSYYKILIDLFKFYAE